MYFFIDLDARPWDFQSEECALRTCVDAFNNRRYNNNIQAINELDMNSELFFNMNALNLNPNSGDFGASEEVVLSEEFKQNYELWLEQEVFKTEIDWDVLLTPLID